MKKLIFSAALVLSLTALAACGDEETKETTATQETATTTETEEIEKEAAEEDVSEPAENGIYFKDGEVKINDLMIKITETKVIPVGEPGNEYGEKPVFAIWYDTTNLTDKEIDPMTAWMAVFEVVQDNDPNAVNELNVGMLPDQAHLDSQIEVIKKDGTVQNSIAYELDDEETPVTLIATQGIGGEELGRQDYHIK